MIFLNCKIVWGESKPVFATVSEGLLPIDLTQTIEVTVPIKAKVTYFNRQLWKELCNEKRHDH